MNKEKLIDEITNAKRSLIYTYKSDITELFPDRGNFFVFDRSNAQYDENRIANAINDGKT